MSFAIPLRRDRIPPASAAAGAAPLAVAVLGPARGAPALGAALALRLAAGAAPCALLAGPRRLTAPRFPARPEASRAARALAAREIPAVASGRLVRAELPEPAAFGRAAAAVPGPAVLLVPGPRSDELDGILTALDALLLAAAEGEGDAGAFAGLAAESLAALGPPVVLAAPPWAPVGAALALAGLAAPAPLGPAVRPVLAAVR